MELVCKLGLGVIPDHHFCVWEFRGLPTSHHCQQVRPVQHLCDSHTTTLPKVCTLNFIRSSNRLETKSTIEQTKAVQWRPTRPHPPSPFAPLTYPALLYERLRVINANSVVHGAYEAVCA